MKLVLALCTGAAISSAILAQPYRLDPTDIDACGGIAPSCTTLVLEGEVVLDLDLLPSRNPLVYADFWLPNYPDSVWPGPQLIGLEELEPTVISPTEFRLHANDGVQIVDLSFVLSGEAELLMSGQYSEPCCDAFTYVFSDVMLTRTATPRQHRLHLQQRSFTISATWHTAEASGAARAVSLNPSAGYLWFFHSTNPELLIKALNPCGPTLVRDSKWLFIAGATNVGVTVKVHDNIVPWRSQTYTSPHGVAFQPVLDTSSYFHGCP